MDTARFEPLDFHHVSNKFPDASPDLIKRLALAITKRRAILCYRKRHSKGPGQRLEASFDDQSGTQSNQLSESDTHSSDYLEHSSISHTTEHISTGEKSAYSQKLPHSNASEAAISLPSAPAASRKSSPFECLYCYRIISVPDGRGWAHHVFRDLMPYVCTFPDCSTPHILYETRREWYFHLQSQHSVGTDPEDRIFCPLCPSSGAVGKKFEKHLGRHLEELALFALSRPDLDAENSKESQGDAERPASLGPEDITNRTKPNSDDGSEDKVADTPPFKKGSQAFPRDKSRGLFKQLRHASIPRHNDQPISPDEFFLTLETPVPEFEHLTIEEPEGELSTKDQFEDRCISASENEGPGKRANDSTRETESWISLKYGIGHEIRYPFWQCRYWNVRGTLSEPIGLFTLA